MPVIQEGLSETETLLPEDRLLFLSTKPVSFSLDDQEFKALLAQIEDWKSLLKKAFRHRLIPRLYFYLKERGGETLRADIWQMTKTAHRRAQFHTLAVEGQTTELLPRLHERGVDTLLLKGAALLQNVYRGNPLRFLGDLDLLIHPEDLLKTEAVLESLGYQQIVRSFFPSRWHDRVIASSLPKNAHNWVHPQKGVEVDLHLEPFPHSFPVSLESDWLWRESEGVAVRDVPARIPSPNRLFLHLLLHLAKHVGGPTNYYAWYPELNDCLEYFGRQIDGRFLRQEIQETSIYSNLLRLLKFVHFHYASPLPPELQFLIEDPAVEPLPLESIFQLHEERSEIDTFCDISWQNRREQILFFLRQTPGLWNKVIFFLRWLFPDALYLRKKYPFSSGFEKITAYSKNFFLVTVKGFLLTAYWLKGKMKGGGF